MCKHVKSATSWITLHCTSSFNQQHTRFNHFLPKNSFCEAKSLEYRQRISYQSCTILPLTASNNLTTVIVRSRSREPDEGGQNSEQVIALGTQDPMGHSLPIEKASAMFPPTKGRLDPGHHQDRSDDHGTSSSAPSFKEGKTGDGLEERGEARRRRGEAVGNAKGKEEAKYVKMNKEERRGRGECGGADAPDQKTTTQPDPPTTRERRASDVVRVFWDLIDWQWEEIPPDSSDRRGAWTGEKQRKMDEELRKMYEERGWSA